MKSNQRAKVSQSQNALEKQKTSGTDPQKVKQDIQKDISAGEGAMTSREAGSMRD